MKTTTTAIGLAALLGALPVAGSAQSPDDEELLVAAPEPATSLKISGFADFRYARFYTNGDHRWQLRGIPKYGAFSVGNLNLYLDGRLDQNLRSLIEVRFSYLPGGVGLQGSSDPLSSGTGLYTSTLGYDYAQLRAKEAWGGIIIQRAWLEYRLDQALTLRAGQFLTPYGVWNVDHGSPTLIDSAPPFVIGQELLPRGQVGVEAYGSVFLGDSRLGYHLTASNGRIDANPQFLDFDRNVGVGGRVFFETGVLGELRIGASAYRGRYTDVRQGLEYTTELPSAPGVPLFVPLTSTESAWELGLATDLRWDLGRLTIIGEYLEQQITDASETRTIGSGPSAVTPPPTRISDYTRRGWYALAGFRLPGALMPFGVIQYINDSRGDFKFDAAQEAYAYTGGLNWRLRPNVVLKVSYTFARWPRTDPALENKDPLKWLATQVAWAF